MSGRSVILGIDLGTTYSLAAVFDERGPRILPNALGERLTPSAVSIDAAGAVLIGAPARARATTHSSLTALSFKRDMGTERTYSLGGRAYRPQELSALVLGSLKRDAEAALGHSVEEAVITVPAYFGDAQRQATRDAGAIAGLRVDRIINEPTAAALAYGIHERGREARIAVLDLGGGTFDVTVLEIIEGVIEIQSSAGNARLGGDDFDGSLATFVRDKITREAAFSLADDGETQARLLSACELAKRRLSSEPTARIALVGVLTDDGRRRDVELVLSRHEVEDAWAALLSDVRGPVLRALRDAGTTAAKIDEVLLVGGSTRMPCIVKLSAQLFGRLPVRTLPPDEAVALGAAVQGALKAGHRAVEDLVVTDVAPFTMGVASLAVVGERAVSGVFSPILERGTVIPASRVERYWTTSNYQTEILVQVFEGEHSICADNRKLGEYKVVGIPPCPVGEQGVDIRFSYDLNGILEVETTILSLRVTQSLVIEHSPGRLSAREIERARVALARLKLHPREALPNATTLARADALYMDLLGADRSRLGTVIARFRSALDAQRPEAIVQIRAELNALVEAIRARVS